MTSVEYVVVSREFKIQVSCLAGARAVSKPGLSGLRTAVRRRDEGHFGGLGRYAGFHPAVSLNFVILSPSSCFARGLCWGVAVGSWTSRIVGRNTCVVVTIRCPWWWWVSLPGPSCLSGPVRHDYPLVSRAGILVMTVRVSCRFGRCLRVVTTTSSGGLLSSVLLCSSRLARWSTLYCGPCRCPPISSLFFLKCRCVEAPQDTHEASFASVVFPDVRGRRATSRIRLSGLV